MVGVVGAMGLAAAGSAGAATNRLETNVRSSWRRRTRRQQLRQRTHDLAARVFWRGARWYGRELNALARPHLVRWSVVAAFTAALGGITLWKRGRPSRAGV